MRKIIVLLVAMLMLSACGETVSASDRIDRCLNKQPDATKADCEKWEQAGELADNGTHEGHSGG